MSPALREHRIEAFGALLRDQPIRPVLTRSERDGAHEVFVWQGESLKMILSTFNRADADSVMALANV